MLSHSSLFRYSSNNHHTIFFPTAFVRREKKRLIKRKQVTNQAQAKTTKKQKQTRVTTQAQASTALHPNNSKATKLKNRKVGGQNKTAPIKKANKPKQKEN